VAIHLAHDAGCFYITAMGTPQSKFTCSVRELEPTDWAAVEQLFGARGACGGCWCMHWRTAKGGKTWEAVKGEPNRKAFRKLVESGQAHGILAFDGDTPVGWCSFGKRLDFPRLERTKAYVREDSEDVWSVNCLFVAPGYRGQHIGLRMVEAAITAIKKRGGRMIEAYPVTLTKEGKKLPAAFSFTGPETLYQRLGFREAQRLAPSKPLYRLAR
jgi:GNAT superfamily N-acetyltransferase